MSHSLVGRVIVKQRETADYRAACSGNFQSNAIPTRIVLMRISPRTSFQEEMECEYSQQCC